MSAEQDEAAVDVMAVGCPFCGASSHEPCWSDVFAHERMHPHGARIRLAYGIKRTTTPTPAAEAGRREESGR